MQEHIQNGIIEEISKCPSREVVHYVPHHAVIREDDESKKLRIAYDCSAKESPDKLSLNDCLETGPSLQLLLFDILLQNRMSYYCITGDIKKAFLKFEFILKTAILYAYCGTRISSPNRLKNIDSPEQFLELVHVRTF